MISEVGTPLDIPMDELLIDHDFNHRGEVIGKFDVVDLVNNIAEYGLQSPITVQPWNEGKYRYKVVMGHRRATAFKVLKRATIPGFVKVYKDQLSAKTASLIENLHRKGLNIKQEAHALKVFVDAGWPEEQIATHLQQSRGWVKIRLLLLKLPDKVQDYCAAGLLTQAHITYLQGKSEQAQLEFIHEVKEAKLKGEKVTLEKPVRKINPHLRKPRTREEVFEKITELYGLAKEMGFWARCLSWSAGEISEYELMKSFEKFAEENGFTYKVPKEMIAAAVAV